MLFPLVQASESFDCWPQNSATKKHKFLKPLPGRNVCFNIFKKAKTEDNQVKTNSAHFESLQNFVAKILI